MSCWIGALSREWGRPGGRAPKWRETAQARLYIRAYHGQAHSLGYYTEERKTRAYLGPDIVAMEIFRAGPKKKSNFSAPGALYRLTLSAYFVLTPPASPPWRGAPPRSKGRTFGRSHFRHIWAFP